MTSTDQTPAQDVQRSAETQAPRPRYEPPRITKRRSVSRATLFSGAQTTGGPSSQGIVTTPP